MACVAPAALDEAIAEIQRCAALGFRGLSCRASRCSGRPTSTTSTTTSREFEPLWDCIEDVDLPVTFHVSTGRDPRTARSQGGAVINYTVHSLAPTMEPLINICASGVAERHPKLRFGAIEAGIGWVAVDARGDGRGVPQAPHVGAARSWSCCRASTSAARASPRFQEDKAGLDLAREHGLVDNFLWANDFPHHEGSWPYSAQAIERTMGDLDDAERARILGLNSARIFRLPDPRAVPRATTTPRPWRAGRGADHAGTPARTRGESGGDLRGERAGGRPGPGADRRASVRAGQRLG